MSQASGFGHDHAAVADLAYHQPGGSSRSQKPRLRGLAGFGAKQILKGAGGLCGQVAHALISIGSPASSGQ